MALRALEHGGPRGVAEFMGVFLSQTYQSTGMPDAGDLPPEKRRKSLGSRLWRQMTDSLNHLRIGGHPFPVPAKTCRMCSAYAAGAAAGIDFGVSRWAVVATE
jgi:hypothetical protein